MSGFPTWGSGNKRRNFQRIRIWKLVGFDCRALKGQGETETPLVEGAHKVVCASAPGGKSSDPTGDWTRPTCYCWRVSCRGGGMAVVHCGDKDTGSRSSGKYSLAWALLKSAIRPKKEPVASSDGLPQAKKKTGRELSPTHQQTSRLKFYWALPPEQHPVLPTTSPSHQEACTSLLDRLTHQKAESRSKKNYSPAACGT